VFVTYQKTCLKSKYHFILSWHYIDRFWGHLFAICITLTHFHCDDSSNFFCGAQKDRSFVVSWSLLSSATLSIFVSKAEKFHERLLWN